MDTSSAAAGCLNQVSKKTVDRETSNIPGAVQFEVGPQSWSANKFLGDAWRG